MKRPLWLVALIYTGGVVAANCIALPLIALLVPSLALALASLAWSRMRSVCLWLLLPLVGCTNLTLKNAVLSPHDLRLLLGQRTEFVTLRGRLIETPTQRVYESRAEESWHTLARLDASALARDATWQPAFGRVAVTTPGVLGGDFFAGQTIEVIGVIQPPDGPAAEGLFDYRAYLRRQGIHYRIRTQGSNDWRIVPTGESPLRPPMADRFREWARATLAQGLPTGDTLVKKHNEAEESNSLPLLWAMALGWTTALTDEVSAPFMRTGTLHIFAISGLHIALIAGILVALLRVLRIPRSVCGWLVIPLIWFYTAATGWQPSAIRSTIMMTVIIVGWALKRPSDLLNSLAAAGFIILLWDPQQLFQASFQLSFFVVLSIALLLPPLETLRQRLLRTDPLLPPELRPRWRRWLEGPVHFVTTSIATSLAAWLGSLPLIAYYFHLFTPISLLANLVIVPLSSLALACNLGSLLCASWPALSALFNHSGWFWMEAIVKLGGGFAALPGAWFYVPAPGWVGFVAYYALLFGVLTGWLLAPSRRRWTAFGVCALALFGLIRWHAHYQDVRVTVLPLNGGDSIFVDAPRRSNDLLIDTGDTSAAEFVVEPFLRGQGVNRLAQLLLTHGDLRHIGGATNLLDDFRVETVFASGIRFRSPTYQRIVSNLGLPRARPREVNRADQFGPWTVLHPQAGDRFALADDSTLVLRGEFHGTRVLFCSDLGKLGQQTLLDREKDLRADVVVAGIPAREEPLSAELLEGIRPKAIIISAGDYPATERVTDQLRERLGRREIPVYYTPDDGAVTLTLRPKGWEIRTMSGNRSTVADKKGMNEGSDRLVNGGTR